MQEKKWPNFSKKLIFNVGSILSSGKINYTNGPYGKKFEKEFSKFIGNNYSIAICNGTAALEVAIRSLNLPKKLKNNSVPLMKKLEILHLTKDFTLDILYWLIVISG